MHLTQTTVFARSPASDTVVMGGAFYTQPKGTELVSIVAHSSASDMLDDEHYRWSTDNGATWGPEKLIETGQAVPGGAMRRHVRGAWLDPATGRLLMLRNQAVLPNNEVMEFLTHNTIHYAISEDGGRTLLADVPLVHAGTEFDEQHPIPGVRQGANCFMLGDFGQLPVGLKDGRILLPYQVSPVGPDGAYQNRGGGFTYTDVGVLWGSWESDRKLRWEAGGMVIADPQRTTRGLIEPTMALLDDRRVLMVMRGSNHTRPQLPGYRWYSISDDQGESWSEASPWFYHSSGAESDRDFVHSASSCSQLLAHSSGRLFWLGNASDTNPDGNHPRYPFVVAEVDRSSGGLIRNQLLEVDTRRPEEPEFVTLSNFYAHEDRVTGALVAYVLRMVREDDRTVVQGDCLRYEISLD